MTTPNIAPIELLLFRTTLTTEVRRGFVIIPLVGAGISVASGIPAIAQLSQYLELCVVRSLTHPYDRHSISGHYRRQNWLPQSSLWDPANKKEVAVQGQRALWEGWVTGWRD